MITRRSFLSSILGTAVAGTLLTRLEPLAADVSFPAIPREDALWFRTFDAMLEEARRLFDATWTADVRDIYGLVGEPFATTFRYQTADHELRDYTSQINIGFETYDAHAAEAHPERSLAPAMGCMAVSAIEDGLGEFSALQLPKAVEFAAMNGPLRMIVAYNPMTNAYVTRFDVRGRTTAPMLKLARYRQQEALKGRIRERLRLSARGQALITVANYRFQA